MLINPLKHYSINVNILRSNAELKKFNAHADLIFKVLVYFIAIGKVQMAVKYRFSVIKKPYQLHHFFNPSENAVYTTYQLYIVQAFFIGNFYLTKNIKPTTHITTHTF